MADIGVGRRTVLLRGVDHDAPDQLLGERGGHSLGAGRRGVHGCLAQLAGGEQLRRVQPEQPLPSLQVRLGDLHRQIDPAGPLDEGALQQVDPVGGQDEGDVGVRGQAVHRLQRLEQRGVGVPSAMLGHQIAILEHDDGRLRGPGQGGGLVQQVERPAGEQHRGGAGGLAQEVPDQMRLAGARRTVEQHAALEMLTRTAQCLASLPHPHHMPGDALDYPFRQHDLVGADLRSAEEPQSGAGLVVVEVVDGEGDHLAAEQAELGHPLPDPGQEGVGRRGARRQHLEGVTLPAVARLRSPLQPDQRHAAEGDLADADGHHPPVGVGAGGLALVRDRPDGERDVGAGQVVHDRVHVTAISAADAHPAALVLGEERLERQVHVDGLVRREPLRDRLDLVERYAQKRLDLLTERGQLRPIALHGRRHRLGEGLIGASESSDLRVHEASG